MRSALRTVIPAVLIAGMWGAAGLTGANAADGGGFQPALFELRAGFGGGASLRSGTSAFAGGVYVAYERLSLEADRIDLAQVTVPGLRRTVPSLFHLIPATAGARVVIDTLGTELPQFPLRMRVTPLSARIDLIPSATAGTLRWRLVMIDPPPFLTDVRGSDGTWFHHVITANRVEAEIEATPVSGEMGSPVLRDLRLFGRSATAGQAQELAIIRRFRDPVVDPTQPPGSPLLVAQALRLSLPCSPTGETLGFEAGDAFSMRGLDDPRLPMFMPGQKRQPKASGTAATH